MNENDNINKGVSSYSNERNNLRQSKNNNIENPENNENINNNEINNTNNINRPIKEISLKYCCCTPYFIFGKSIFFYFPNSLNDLDISSNYYSNTVDLYQMPDPPFSIGIKCK